MTESAGEEEGAEPRRRRVLVVDDEPAIGEVIRRILSDEYKVEVTTSGSAARNRLREDQAFDAIVCDLIMPDGTGMELHQSLEEDLPELARVMIFITGGAFTSRARAFVASSTNPVLAKPLSPKELRDTVRRVVDLTPEPTS